jgi:MFS transporter, AAHS family, 4-hydroxybenzoate transporter
MSELSSSHASSQGSQEQRGAAQRSTLSVSGLIDSRPIGRVHWAAFILCGAIVLLDGYDLQALGLAAPLIAHRWSIPPSALGWALAASLVGLGLGSAFLAPLGDKLGRRPVLAAGLLCIAASTGATAMATGVGALEVLRFVTGAGLGVCQANATALAAEWSPLRRRASVVTIISCQVALGALVAGLVTPRLIALWDWPGIFIAGALGPLLLMVLVWALLPESLAFLARSPRHAERFRALLARVDPRMEPARLGPDPQAARVPGSLRAVLGPRYLRSTIGFWAMFAIASFLVYLLISWLPVVLTGAGWSPPQAARGIALYQGGGIAGALILARYIDRGLTFPALIAAYVLAGCIGAAFPYTGATAGLWPLLLCLLGATVSGGLFGVLAVGALLYPSDLRATGLGLGAAVARVGATLGPLAGGWVLARGVPSAQILAWLALPAVVAALTVVFLRRSTRVEVGKFREQPDG